MDKKEYLKLIRQYVEKTISAEDLKRLREQQKINKEKSNGR